MDLTIILYHRRSSCSACVPYHFMCHIFLACYFPCVGTTISSTFLSHVTRGLDSTTFGGRGVEPAFLTRSRKHPITNCLEFSRPNFGGVQHIVFIFTLSRPFLGLQQTTFVSTVFLHHKYFLFSRPIFMSYITIFFISTFSRPFQGMTISRPFQFRNFPANLHGL